MASGGSARGKRRVVQRFEGVVEETFDGGAYITVAFGTKRLRGVVLDDAALEAAACLLYTSPSPRDS